MALTYGDQFHGPTPPGAYRGFISKRIARVYPLYFVVTLAAFALNLARIPDPSTITTSPISIASSLMMVQSWGIGDSVVGPTWSISAEFAAYLVFPVLVRAALNGGRGQLWGAGVIATGLVVILATRSSPELHQDMGGRMGPMDIYGNGTPYPVLRCFASFTLGMLSYSVASRSKITRRHSADAVIALMLVLLAIPGSDIAVVLLCPVLVVTLAISPSISGGILGSPLVYLIGELSYSIYLVHEPMTNTLRVPFTSILERLHVPHAFTMSNAVVAILVFPLSAALYFWVERPARSYLRQAMQPKTTVG